MTDQVNKNLSNILNIETTLPPHKVPREITNKKVEDLNEDEEAKRLKDFEIARINIKTLLVKGEEALDGILDLAQSGEHPRAYEVAGQIIKTLVDANKDLMSLHKKKEVKEAPQEPNKVINNSIVFNGTTTELQAALKKMREDNADV